MPHKIKEINTYIYKYILFIIRVEFVHFIYVQVHHKFEFKQYAFEFKKKSKSGILKEKGN
jgi:hypothetical protein